MLSGLRIAAVFIGLLFLGSAQPADALVVRNKSPVTLPFARRLNFTGTGKLLEIDQARARALKSRVKGTHGKAARAIIDAPASNGVVDYVATVCFTLRGSACKRS